jgi:ABC-type phosphate transport system substrate-binding protein
MDMTKMMCVLWACALFVPSAATADDDLTVVVNKSNAVENLTKAQLCKIVLGEQAAWPGAKKVMVVLRAPGQPDRKGVLRSVCGMGEDDFTTHQMQASFNGDAGSPPKVVASDEAARDMVAAQPGAIGFLQAADVNDTVRPVTVDGVAAGKDGYKVKSSK